MKRKLPEALPARPTTLKWQKELGKMDPRDRRQVEVVIERFLVPRAYFDFVRTPRCNYFIDTRSGTVVRVHGGFQVPLQFEFEYSTDTLVAHPTADIMATFFAKLREDTALEYSAVALFAGVPAKLVRRYSAAKRAYSEAHAALEGYNANRAVIEAYDGYVAFFCDREPLSTAEKRAMQLAIDVKEEMLAVLRC